MEWFENRSLIGKNESMKVAVCGPLRLFWLLLPTWSFQVLLLARARAQQNFLHVLLLAHVETILLRIQDCQK